MDISSVSNAVNSDAIQLMAAVKCIKSQQASMQAVGSIIEDTAEFSAEAIARYRAEQQQ